MADYITDIKIIEDFFRHRHFDIQMPDNTIDDFDNGVADYYSRQKGLGKCLDTNGSEYLVYKIREDSTIEINFLFFERIFEKGRWDEKNFRTKGKLYLREDSLLYRVDEIEELPDDYYPFGE